MKHGKCLYGMILLVAILGLSVGTSAAENEHLFDTFFRAGALRIDLYHSGNARAEHYSLDEIRWEAIYSGPQTKLLDTTGYGKHFFQIFDANTNQLLFSRGYCSIFGEWQTTDEAKKQDRVFEESIRFPLPKNRVRLTIQSRNQLGLFEEVFSTLIDPNSYLVSRKQYHKQIKVQELRHNGDIARNLDVLILGDGYSQAEMAKYHRDLDRFSEIFYHTPPYQEAASRINLWALDVISNDSGIDEPRKGIFKDTALGTAFNSFDSPRYILSLENKKIRNFAANAPYDFIYIMVNTSGYGGGGIYQLYSTFIADNEYDEYVFIHEFGHSFGGLADEYYQSGTAYGDFYPAKVEPWEPNITALLDSKTIKWQNLVTLGVPLPTPFDPKYQGMVGAFEGAGYTEKGLFRPAQDCKMFSKGKMAYCPVCRQAIKKMLDLYTE
jgi:hypothetical protein